MNPKKIVNLQTSNMHIENTRLIAAHVFHNIHLEIIYKNIQARIIQTNNIDQQLSIPLILNTSTNVLSQQVLDPVKYLSRR